MAGCARSAAVGTVGLALLISGCAPAPVVVAPAPQATPTPTPVPPTPTPTPPPTGPPLAGPVPERADARPPRVRILLQVAAEPALPEPGRRYACVVAGQAPTVLRGPIRTAVLAGRPAMQVGAFQQDANTQQLLSRLAAAGFDGRVETDAAGLRRVTALAVDGERDEALAQRLRQAGFTDARRSGTVSAVVLAQGEDGATAQGPTVRLVPLDADPVRVGAKSVRGELELRPSAGGVIVVNVVNLEQYLRGVVPAEMGPRSFPLLETLKAQAVAARTYAVAHLGDHAAEGYDLCDSQLCQVYEGAGAEQPLSDRAVLESAGEVVTYQGKPIDAMYHSTCAGHTEDGAAVFPQRAAPYLKGVACRGERVLVAGVTPSPRPWVGPLERLAAVAGELAAALTVSPQAAALAERLTGAKPEPGVAGLLQAFALDRAPAVLRAAHSDAPAEAAVEMLRVFRLPLPPRRGSLAEWELALTVRLAQLGGEVQALAGRLVPGPSGLRLVPDGAEEARDLGGRVAVMERDGERWRLRKLEFAAGSPATLWCAGTACPVVEVEPLREADGASAWSWWVRDVTLEEVGRKLEVAGVRTVAVVRRGVSGRALSVAVTGDGGTREFPGLAIRRALGLPDTLFVAIPARSAARPSLRFLGRGWGHGVGMCQNGAYGLARGGATYVDILKTYYTGVDVVRWEGGEHGGGPGAPNRSP